MSSSQTKANMKASISLKIIATAMVILGLGFLSLFILISNQLNKEIEENFEREGNLLIQAVSSPIAEAIITSDLPVLESTLLSLIASNKEIVKMALYDTDSTAIVEKRAPNFDNLDSESLKTFSSSISIQEEGQSDTYKIGIAKLWISTIKKNQEILTKKLEISVLFGVVFIVLMISLFVAMRTSILRPISLITDASIKLGAGQWATRLKGNFREDELGELSDNFNYLASKIESLILQQKTILEATQVMASQDELQASIIHAVIQIDATTDVQLNNSKFLIYSASQDTLLQYTFHRLEGVSHSKPKINISRVSKNDYHLRIAECTKDSIYIDNRLYILAKWHHNLVGFLEIASPPQLDEEDIKYLASFMNSCAMMIYNDSNKEMKSVFEFIEVGIFTIDTELKIRPFYSNYFSKIFPEVRLSGKALPELLKKFSNMSNEDLGKIASIVQTSIGEETLGFQLNKNSLPRNTKITSNNHTRDIAIDWHPILDESGYIIHVMVTFRDVTKLKRLEAQTEARENELQMLMEITHLDRNSFFNYLKEATKMIEEIRDMLFKKDLNHLALKQKLLLQLHTLKGNSRVFGLNILSAAIHEVESNYSNSDATYKKITFSFDHKQTIRDINRIEKLLVTYRKTSRKVYSNLIETDSLPEQIASEILHIIEDQSFDSEQKLGKIRQIASQEQHLKLEDIIKLISISCRKIARPRGLKLHFELHCGNIEIHSQISSVIRGILNHIFTNSIDHGMAIHKEGKITLHARQAKDDLVTMLVSDSGRGLNIDKLYKIGREKGLLNESSDDEEIAELIFSESISTQKESSQTSGRGVGMDAVRSDLTKLGGSIKITLLQDLEPGFRKFVFDIQFRNRPFPTMDTAPDDAA